MLRTAFVIVATREGDTSATTNVVVHMPCHTASASQRYEAKYAAHCSARAVWQAQIRRGGIVLYGGGNSGGEMASGVMLWLNRRYANSGARVTPLSYRQS